jgi:RNA polymerase sigma factor (sigma-70 family)
VDDEAALVARACEGDEHAFAVLLEGVRDRSWAVCYRVCGNSEDAADALQDAALAAWCGLASFRGDARFSTWFYRIAANASLQVVRRRRDLPHAQVPEVPGGDGTEFADGIHASQVLQEALQQIGPEFRTALVLREWGDFTYAEIAEWQGIPVQTVKSRLHRARNALARLLEDVR